TGTEIGAPRSIAFMPRTRPSAGFIEMHRTRFSPRCCATSVMRSIFSVERPSSSTMLTAFRIDASFPAGNSTTTTGTMIWTTVHCVSILRDLFPMVRGGSSTESRGPRDDLDQFLGDARLARAVVLEGEGVDHLPRVLRCGVHRGHARAVLGRVRLEED